MLFDKYIPVKYPYDTFGEELSKENFVNTLLFLAEHGHFPNDAFFGGRYSENIAEVEFETAASLPEDEHSGRTLIEILDMAGNDCQLILELDYVDKYHRDSYMEYYLARYANIKRNCIRIFLFDKSINIADVDDLFTINTEELQDHFIGTIVLRPIHHSVIGHTLLNPYRLFTGNNDHSKDNYTLRVTKFKVHLANHKLYIKSFPYSMQDGITASCAETTIERLLEYYNNKYPNYRELLVSDIRRIARSLTGRQELPSEGLNYSTVSRILVEAGFEPRLLTPKNYKIDQESIMKALFSYVESGIPLGVGTVTSKAAQEQHHLCSYIGHGPADFQKMHKDILNQEARYEENEFKYKGKRHTVYFINIASYVSEYITMDDNHAPYSIINFDDSSKRNQSLLVSLNVPLYKKMQMTPEGAENYAKNWFGYSDNLEILGLDINIGKSQNSPIVYRCFLCPGKKLKRERIAQMQGNPDLALIYANLNLTNFVWVFEFGTSYGFERGNIDGEIIIDATGKGNFNGNQNDLSYIFINSGKAQLIYDPDSHHVVRYEYDLTESELQLKCYDGNLNRMDDLQDLKKDSQQPETN